MPVLRPGVYAIGEACAEGVVSWTVARSDAGTGRTKMGLKLPELEDCQSGDQGWWVVFPIPDGEPDQLYPGHPVRNDDVPCFRIPRRICLGKVLPNRGTGINFVIDGARHVVAALVYLFLVA